MSSDASLSPIERLWKLETTINKAIVDGKWDPVSVSNHLQVVISNHAGSFNSAKTWDELFQQTADLESVKVPDMYVLSQEESMSPCDPLNPGEWLRVLAFRPQRSVSLETVLGFLAFRKGIFTGIQGAQLLWEQRGSQLPRRWDFLSFGYSLKNLPSQPFAVPGIATYGNRGIFPELRKSNALNFKQDTSFLYFTR